MVSIIVVRHAWIDPNGPLRDKCDSPILATSQMHRAVYEFKSENSVFWIYATHDHQHDGCLRVIVSCFQVKVIYNPVYSGFFLF